MDQRALALVLRLFGILDLCALAAVLMPHRWMAVIHVGLGMGELPEAPIVGYLTRSASALYALHGALVLFVSFDVQRYARLITFLAVAAVVHGLLILAVDLAVGMPLFWTLLEGPGIIATGVVVLLVQRIA